MKPFKKAVIVLCIVCLIGATGCKPPHVSSLSGFYFDTIITITLYDTTERVVSGALDLCASFDALLSKTKEGSDVYRINHANGEPVTVDAHTRTLIERAIDYSALTDGVFDITVAPLTALWDFSGDALPPTEADITPLLKSVDYSQITISGDTVRLPKGMQIDLGGIAKGYIADQLVEYCVQNGVQHGLLNLGGNISVIGTRPNGQPWDIGVQNPHASNGTSLTNVQAVNQCVVTSGTYQRSFVYQGTLYHHILDPKTGWPVQNGLASVSILAPHALDGDALSTACFVLGPEKARALIESLDGIEAVFIYDDLRIESTSGITLASTP